MFRNLSKAPILVYKILPYHMILLDKAKTVQNKLDYIQQIKRIFGDIVRYNNPLFPNDVFVLRLIEYELKKVHVNLSDDESRFYFVRKRQNIYNVLDYPQINLDNIIQNFDESSNLSEFMVIFQNMKSGETSLCVLQIDTPKINVHAELTQFLDKEILKQNEHVKNPIIIHFDKLNKRAIDSHTFSIKIYNNIFQFKHFPIITSSDGNPTAKTKLKITPTLITKRSITQSCEKYEKDLIASHDHLSAIEKSVNELTEQLDKYKIHVDNLQKQLDNAKSKMIEAKQSYNTIHLFAKQFITTHLDINLWCDDSKLENYHETIAILNARKNQENLDQEDYLLIVEQEQLTRKLIEIQEKIRARYIKRTHTRSY